MMRKKPRLLQWLLPENLPVKNPLLPFLRNLAMGVQLPSPNQTLQEGEGLEVWSPRWLNVWRSIGRLSSLQKQLESLPRSGGTRGP